MIEESDLKNGSQNGQYVAALVLTLPSHLTPRSLTHCAGCRQRRHIFSPLQHQQRVPECPNTLQCFQEKRVQLRGGPPNFEASGHEKAERAGRVQESTQQNPREWRPLKPHRSVRQTIQAGDKSHPCEPSLHIPSPLHSLLKYFPCLQ